MVRCPECRKLQLADTIGGSRFCVRCGLHYIVAKIDRTRAPARWQKAAMVLGGVIAGLGVLWLVG